jgi:hypothetical protein
MPLRPEDLVPRPCDLRRVTVPEWAGEVLMCVPSSLRRDLVEAAVWKEGKQDLTNFKARLVALCLCYEDGSPWYPDPIAGAEALGEHSSRIIRRLFRVARQLCPVGDEDLDELEKN